MSHQRYAPQDVTKEPHPISLKVLRLSRPSLVTQYPVATPLSSVVPPPTIPASLAYWDPSSTEGTTGTNPDPFLLSPILNLPPSFGSAYVGESFACTLCVNHDAPDSANGGDGGARKTVRQVRIEAEMKTPSTAGIVKLALERFGSGDSRRSSSDLPDAPVEFTGKGGIDLDVGETLQNIVRFDLKEEGSHILAVTISYYEASETSGRTRTFRKLYQFICRSSLIVRTKAGIYAPKSAKQYSDGAVSTIAHSSSPSRRWILEAQLENCGEDVLRLDEVVLQLEPALYYEDGNNWNGGSLIGSDTRPTGYGSRRPVLHPGEVEQVSFLIMETGPGLQEDDNGRLVFGVLGIGWRSEMGSRGFLSTGKLGTRAVK
ncbi:hypothetical protein SEPCBS119000_005479 [Sporothrix epigloea]|uniref:Trafficking protein particle complex subunit 13 N-terminal domain-containing protein n=1 Tax=Sporothrix epigloea TaxID=1892477 RepID=A0ABP0DXU0_9PEZI